MGRLGATDSSVSIDRQPEPDLLGIPAVQERSAGGGAVTLENLEKRFDDELAVDGVDLQIAAGEFFALLGPSGCGKTTTLRMIGGFERPTSGRVLIDGDDVSTIPPEKRPVNTVFQSYALFPHLPVADNVGFGLRFAKVSKQEAKRRVEEALELVRLTRLAHRRPSQLSGGQQQRVALARALVLRPRVLLLDEPLGALDAKLRKDLRVELTSLQRTVGITFVFVTHDQEEALSMSHRLAVMYNGRIIQCGEPREVYESPATEFVAAFLGVANLFDVEFDASGVCAVSGHPIKVDAGQPAGPGRIVVRPERVRLVEGPVDGEVNTVEGVVRERVYVGAQSQLEVVLADGTVLQVVLPNDGRGVPTPGESVAALLPPEAIQVLTG
jgi:spermidine/putrescine transport system ATP-binding protein